jgi:uncharacterized protein YukE
MAYENKLETWWASLPGEVQSVFGGWFETVNGWIEAVAGDPDDLVRAGVVYAELGPQVTELGGRMLADAQSLNASWEGVAYQSFLTRVTDLEASMRATGEAIAGTQEILNAAAQAAVDGANLIIDIVVMVIEFALYSLAVAAATAIISLGASLAAWAATQLANAAMALSRILAVVQKVAVILQKVAQVLKTIAAILSRIAKLFMSWAKWIRSLPLLPQGVSPTALATYSGQKVLVGLIAKIDGLLGVPTLPSGVTHGIPNVVDSGGDLANSTQNVDDVADSVRR